MKLCVYRVRKKMNLENISFGKTFEITSFMCKTGFQLFRYISETIPDIKNVLQKFYNKIISIHVNNIFLEQLLK